MAFKIRDHSDKSATTEPVVAVSSKEQFLFFVEEHRGLVWGGILLVVVLIAGLVTFNWLSQQAVEESWTLQGQAQKLYLERPLDDAEKGKSNVQEAAGIFQNILDQYPGTSSAKVSSFLLANSLMDGEDYQGAIDAYTAFIQERTQDPILVALVQQRLGLAHLLNGNREAAEGAFHAVLENAQAFNKDQVLFELAKLAESEENTDEAVTYYKQLIQEFPLSPFSTEANLRIKVLAPEDVQESTESDVDTSGEGESESLELQEEISNGESEKTQKKED